MINRALQALERLPGTAVPWIVGLGAVLLVATNLPAWIGATRRFGVLEPALIPPVVALGYFLVLVDVLGRVAHSAFDAFRPALGVGEAEAARLRAEMTAVPDRIGLPMMALFMVVITLGYTLDPAASGATAGLGPVDLLMATVLWLPVTAMVALVTIRTIRQLRLVGRLHAMATQVDLLDPGPIHAFSRLTAATAFGILGIAILFAVPEGGETSIAAIEIVGALGFSVLAVVSFVLPLRGMHGRLASEKQWLVSDVNARLKAVLGRVHEAVDSDDLSRADALQKAQTALLTERDLYLRLSTWPWSQGTFRGFVSAVLLPVLLGVVLRFVGRFVE
jgi:hypothetical protein